MREKKVPEDPRRRILDVAASVFARSGFEGARVDLIAERAGVNKAMLYYHVGDKDALYETVLLETIEDALAHIAEAAASTTTAEERLRATIATIADAARRHPHFPPLMLREIASGGATLPDRVMLRMRSIFQAVRDALDQGSASGEFRPVDPIATHMAIAGSTVVLLAGRPIRERLRAISPIPKGVDAVHTTEDIASFVCDLVLEGLRPSGINRTSRKNGRAARPASRARSSKKK